MLFVKAVLAKALLYSLKADNINVISKAAALLKVTLVIRHVPETAGRLGI